MQTATKTDYKFDAELHAHTFDGKPLIGTSRVGDVVAKNLTWWAAECAAVECLEAGVKITTIREEYLAACASPDKKKAIDALQKKYPVFKKARYAHNEKKKESAGKGTDMHAELEKYVKACIETNDGKPLATVDGHEQVFIFAKWAVQNVKKFLWSEMHCYSAYLWLGGVSDCGYEDINGNIGVIDFKSSKEAYVTQYWQATGYGMEIEENGGYNAEGDKIFDLEGKKIHHVCIFPFGAEKPEPQFNYDMEGNKQAFLSCLTIYKQMQAIEK